MKKRNIDYENKFRKYLFSFDFETHNKICKNINVVPNKGANYEDGYNILMEYWECLPDNEKAYIDKRLKKVGL